MPRSIIRSREDRLWPGLFTVSEMLRTVSHLGRLRNVLHHWRCVFLLCVLFVRESDGVTVFAASRQNPYNADEITLPLNSQPAYLLKALLYNLDHESQY